MGLICEICKSEFECGIENGEDKCWCFNYPKVLEVDSKKCICKKCLENKIEAK
mgnify:CR=1 FL=1|tara:strand:+ start:372 stop:530 length:159 start_codon:yes stop_codon:yes gene_type:complete